ncbi:MAG TPA: ABC transporter substrate-binding protein [Chloroflexota bacterium]|jgi:NitT/TauT family transport system substrate-binding protein
MDASIRNRRDVLRLGLATALLTTGCRTAAPAGHSPSPTTRPQPVTLKIGLPGAGTDPYGVVYVAQKQGFLDKYNLKVEVTEYQGAGPEQEALASGDADIINFNPTSIAQAVKKGVKEKIVAMWQDKPLGWYLMVSAKSSIKTAQDLNGKKVGISGKGTTTDEFSLWYAQQNGIKIQGVPLGGAQAVYSGVVSGNVDAGVVTAPLSERGLATGDLRSLANFGEVLPDISHDVLAASDSIIASHPEAVSNYLKALFEALRYVKQNRSYAIDFLVNYTKVDSATEERVYDTVYKAMPDNVQVNKAWIDADMALAATIGITNVAPVDQIVTTQFVDQSSGGR